MNRPIHLCVLTIVNLGIFASAGRSTPPPDSYAGQIVLINLKRPLHPIASQNRNIEYTFDPSVEQFQVYVPAQYNGVDPYGVFVFMRPSDEMLKFPRGWPDVFQKHKLILLFPAHAGDDSASSRRMGLAVFAAMGAQRQWKIDPARIYVGGFNGGAQIAGQLGFYAPDIFAGSVQMCGADFYKPVPKVEGKPLPTDQSPYGFALSTAEPAEIDAAKKGFRFAFITGAKDPRHGQIRDIVNGGYLKDGFQIKLIDVPGMGQELCPAESLSQALDFITKNKPRPAPIPAPSRAPTPASRPAAPDWMAKDFTQWPQILLRNQLKGKDNNINNAGSSFLARLPSGIVVCGTAGHVMGEVKPADFATTYKSWTAYSPNLPAGGVQMTQVSMDTDNPPTLDVLFLCPSSQHEKWPAAVLPIRTEPLAVGEAVYLIAVPSGSKVRQNGYKGTVIRRGPDGKVQYNIEASFDTKDCSGAPLIDESGRLAGIHLASLNNQDIAGKMQLVCLDAADALKVIKPPADVKPWVEEAPAAAGNAPNNKQADEALRMVQIYINNKLYTKARAKLLEIIGAYPSTEAAKKAKELLSQLPEK